MFTINSIIMMSLAVIFVLLSLTECKIVGTNIYFWEKSKKNVRLYYSFLICFFLLFGVCIRDSYDIDSYRYAYEARIAHGKEPLFDAIQFYFHDNGWTFNSFKVMWLVLTTIFLYAGIKKYADKPEAVVGLSFLSVLPSFITQFRSAFVCAVVLNAIQLLFSGKRRDKIIYTAIVLLCAQIHIMAFLFLIFLFVRGQEKKNYGLRYCGLVSLATLFAIGFNRYMVIIIDVLTEIVPMFSSISDRIISAVSGIETPIKAIIFLICKQLFLYIMTDRACKLSKKKATGEITYYNCISEINNLSLFFLPLCIINASFLRVYNPIILLQYAVILNVGNMKMRISDKIGLNVRMKTLLICFALFLFVVDVCSGPDDLVRMMKSIMF